jgi:hypothetical protein
MTRLTRGKRYLMGPSEPTAVDNPEDYGWVRIAVYQDSPIQISVQADYTSPPLYGQAAQLAGDVVFHAALRLIAAGRKTPFDVTGYDTFTRVYPQSGVTWNRKWLADVKAQTLVRVQDDDDGRGSGLRGTLFVAKAPTDDETLLVAAFRALSQGHTKFARRYLQRPDEE